MLLQIQQAHYKKSFMVEPFITIFTYIIGIRNFPKECNYKKRNKHRQCYIIGDS